jgi:hypothetical protein
MKTYIPKQPKHTRERIEAKLDTRLVRQLERYCEYLDSDRDERHEALESVPSARRTWREAALHGS